MNPITKALKAAKTRTALAKACDVSRTAVMKWEENEKLPRTEWTGETNYAERIYKSFGVIVPPFQPEENIPHRR